MSEEAAHPKERRYANWLNIGFNKDEVVLDFGQAFDDVTPVAHTGLVTTPHGAREFMHILQNSVAEQERLAREPGGDDPEPASAEFKNKREPSAQS